MPDLPTTQRREQWLDRLTSKVATKENKPHFWGNDPSCLVTRSIIDPQFVAGSGADIYEKNIVPALLCAKYEIIFVTCFWARSSTLDQLFSTLVRLSNEGLAQPDNVPKLRVRLCFSSFSLTQMIFHTSSAAGHAYPPSKWSSLGLPAPELLVGLDLRIKSLFYLPFSVMHPKFIIIDRQRALLPSCNLSWESWLECCLPISGSAVSTLVSFWHYTWGRNDLPAVPAMPSIERTNSLCETTILPSPHHHSPHFRLCFAFAPPPATPLNMYLLELFAAASKSIRILTPNLTSPPVIAALLEALQRGVDVVIITNRRMMVLEQLLTAGTITEFCIWKFRRRYRRLVAAGEKTSPNTMEGGLVARPGSLSVGYFIPDSRYARCHIKCTIVDGEVVVFGSGNMDRASWYTSQELGIALEGQHVVTNTWQRIEKEIAAGGGVEWL